MQMDAPVTKEETVYTDDSEDMVSQEIIGGADETNFNLSGKQRRFRFI